MPCVLNALFQGESPEAAGGRDQGWELATRIAKALGLREFSPGDVAAWHDRGWIVDCEVNDWDVRVLITATRSGYWNLQIGLLQGSSTSPMFGAAECYTVARVVSDCLVSSGRYRAFHWRWDLPPREEDPDEPPARSASFR